MDRNDAPEKLKWKLTDIYKNHEDFEVDLQKIYEFLPIFEKYKGKLNNKDVLLDYYKTSDVFNILYHKLGSYVMLNHDVDLNNIQFIEDEENIVFVVYLWCFALKLHSRDWVYWWRGRIDP